MIILLAFAAGIASSGSKIAKSQNVLFDIRNEFNEESPKVINTAILQKNYTTNVSGRYDEFVQNFITYGKTKGSNIDVVYVLSYDNSINVGNYYGEQVVINQNGANTVIQSNQLVSLSKTNSVNVTAGNYTYDFEMETPVDVKGLIRKGTEIVLI